MSRLQSSRSRSLYLANGLFDIGQGESVLALRRMTSSRVRSLPEPRQVSAPKTSSTRFALVLEQERPKPTPLELWAAELSVETRAPATGQPSQKAGGGIAAVQVTATEAKKAGKQNSGLPCPSTLSIRPRISS